jgi:hypothetical protein
VKVSQIYQSSSDWLRAADLAGPSNVTILSVEMTTFRDKETDKPKDQLVLAFDGWDKKLGLNATNARMIASILGDDTANWPGHTITLYVDPNVKQVNGGVGPGVRVLPMLPGATQQQPKPRPGAAPYNLPPVPHTAVGNAVQGVVQRQQRRPAPPAPQGYDGPSDDPYDPLA